MKILGLIASPSDPSSRFRISQYAGPLRESNIELQTSFYRPTKDTSPARWTRYINRLTSINEWRIWNMVQDINRLPLLVEQYNYDVIWQSRLLLPYMLKADKAISKPVVLDLDDAIWMLEGKERTSHAIERAEFVFAGNEYIANWVRPYNKNVHLVPSVIDTRLFYPELTWPSPFTIGWIGSPSNFKYLDLVRPAVEKFLAKHAGARCMIVSSEQPPSWTFGNNIIFRKWDAGRENEMINQFSVGIMPLIDDEWTRGKCGFKLIQYMACGKAVVASGVGVNNILINPNRGLLAGNEEEWFNAFTKFYNEEEAAKEMGRNGRKFIEENYSIQRWAPLVAGHFHTLTNKINT